jgi:hypothetical protein
VFEPAAIRVSHVTGALGGPASLAGLLHAIRAARLSPTQALWGI